MNKRKKIRLIRLTSAALFGAVISCVITGTVLTLIFARYRSHEKELSDYFEAKSVIDKYYIGEADDSEFMSNALKGVVAGLDDPYAAYMTPEEYGKAQEQTSGVLTGIGVTVSFDEEEGCQVEEISPDSPAEKAGILPGDIIIKIGGVSIKNMKPDAIISMIKGELGTPVDVTVKRDGEEIGFSMNRSEIESITVESEMLENDIYYISISGFKDVTSKQFLSALKSGISDNARGIIIDLRGNGGGLLKACEACLDPFLPEGDIATAQFKDGSESVICRSDEKEMNIPTAILVNESTASASELFCSAMRDFNKAKLVGKNTFGKGIMQNTVPLSNGGALKLTVARYKTAKSPCFQGVGIAPDYEVDLPEGTDISTPDPEKDPQLKKAMEILK